MPVRYEAYHRLTVLGGIAALLLLSTSPVFAHHLARGAQSVVGNADHLGALCMAALLMLLEPVHYAFHLLLLVGVVYAVWDRLRAARSLKYALAPLDARPPAVGEAFWEASREAGVDPARVRIVAALPTPALTAGIIRPLIYVSRDLLVILSRDELIAVLAHEDAHLRRRDPLRLSLLRFLACTLFWVPAVRRLADDVADEAEVLADDHARKDRPLVLATAILRLAGRVQNRVLPTATVGFVRSTLLDRRVRRLAGQQVHAHSHLTRSSVVGALAALLLVWTSGLAAGTAHVRHPIVMRESHCESHEGSALRHLFCLGHPFSKLAHVCPHESDRHSHPAATSADSQPLNM
jgi:Zn-dependent protease with chaperone function